MTRIIKNPEIRRNELIDIAEELFLKHSYAQTTVSDIVKKVGVAQGTTPQEYVACARELTAMGYTHLAIGGLLRRRGDSEKSRQIGAGPLRRVDEGLLWATLRLMRDELDPPWLQMICASWIPCWNPPHV